MTKNVLIVEDQPQFRHMLKEALAAEIPSLEYSEAETGKQARAKIIERQPDLILMDISLPDENGLHLTKEIKDRHPGIMVLVITNHDLPEFEESAYQMGADRFISKKVSFQRISDEIKLLLYVD